MVSLDHLANRLLPQPAVSLNAEFTPDQSVSDSQLTLVDDSSELTVIIPPWHASERIQQRLAHRQQMLGRSTLVYGFHDDILSPEPKVTVGAFENIANTVAEDVEKLGVEHGLKPRFVATSLGCAALTYAMGERGLSGQAELIVPGHNLAESLWHGIRTRHLRKIFEAQGYDLAALKNIWARLSPTYQAERNIKHSDFQLHVSTADRVIPSRQIHQLTYALRASGNKVAVDYNRHLGHYGTIIAHSFKDPS